MIAKGRDGTLDMMKEPGATLGEAEFRNDPISSGNLPRLDDVDVERLDPAYLKLRMFACAALVALVVVASIVAAFFVPVALAAAGGLVAVLVVAVAAWLLRMEVDYMGYSVRQHDFSFRHGVIRRTVATAPYARVQDVSIERGPVQRRFGLSTLQLRTAGGVIAVPGMGHLVAERLKALVIDRSGELADAEIGR